MQPNMIQDIQQKILALNSDQNPYQYLINNNQIIGSWKIVDAKWSNILASGKVDQNYSITITLDEQSKSYTFTEKKTNKLSNFSFDSPDGGLSFGTEDSSFMGKMNEKEYGWGTGVKVQQNNQPTDSYQYSFDTKTIKEPLFNILDQSGWKLHEDGLFSKFFK